MIDSASSSLAADGRSGTIASAARSYTRDVYLSIVRSGIFGWEMFSCRIRGLLNWVSRVAERG